MSAKHFPRPPYHNYMANAFRYGLIGQSDVPVAAAFGLMLVFVAALGALGLWLLKRGTGMRS